MPNKTINFAAQAIYLLIITSFLSSTNYINLATLTWRQLLVVIFKISILVLLLWALYYQIFGRKDIGALLEAFTEQLSITSIFLVLVTLTLMFVNWGIESVKWQQLMQVVEQLSFVQALKAVFCGITLSLFTPNRVGEYGGRVLLLEKADKLEAVAITLVGSLAQLMANMSAGLLGFAVFCYWYVPLSKWMVYSASLFALLGIIVGVWFYFNLVTLRILAKKIKSKRLQKLSDCLEVVAAFNRPILRRILGLSVLRNATYTLQYWLLLQALGISLNLPTAFVFISSIFFVQTLVPSIALIELGVRGNVALFFMGYVTSNHIGILAATFSLWVINLMLPALVGLLVISQLRIGSR